MNKGNIIKTILFWLLVATVLYLIETLIGTGIKNSSYSHYYKVNLICGNSIKPQVAIFGSSVGEVGISSPKMAELLNKSCYNFSIDGTRFLQYNGLIKEHAHNNDSLELVILAETIMNLENNKAVTSIDRYVANISNSNIYQSLRDVQPDLAFKVRYVPFYKFIIMEHPYYKASMIGWANKLRKTDLSDPNLGFTPKYTDWQVDVDELNNNSKPIIMGLDSFILDKYRSTIRLLNKKNIKVLIVFMPTYIKGQELMLNMDAYRNTYAAMQNPLVQFYDMTSDTMCTNKANFYNNSHVNSAGAERVTQKIVDFVSRN